MDKSGSPCPAPALRRAEWWERADLGYDSDGQLRFAGRRVLDMAAHTGTPAYVYSGERISANVARLRSALATLSDPAPRLLYAMKSNRFAPVLGHLRGLGVGLDVCSPGEVRHALGCGFLETELSFTAGSLSGADYAALAGWPGVWVNADSLSALRRLAIVSPGRRIGLRINPAAGLGYAANPLVRYSGAKPTKFGVYLDRFAEALELAASLGLRIEALHCHTGCGFLTPQLTALDEVFSRVEEFLRLAPGVRRLNLGGGLGIPLTSADAPLDLAAWADLVRRHFASRGLSLEFEPGDYLVKDAGLLLTEVTQVETKGGRVFVGLNAGFNVHPEPAFYRLPLAPAPAQLREGPETTVTLAGNINEALDLWAEDIPLPPVQEGDVLCLLNAGGYGAAMSSSHCLRSEFSEHFLTVTPPFGSMPPLPVPNSILLDQANQRAWDELYRSTTEYVWGLAPLPFVADFMEEFRRALRPPSRLLDAGAGEGRNLGVLLSCGASEVHALDSSLHALNKIPAAIRAQVQCRHADMSATGFPDAFFDGVTVLDAIETLPNSTAVLAELLRILKPGGLLLCNIPGPDDGIAGTDMQAIGPNAFLYRQSYYFRFVDQHEAEALLVRAGFEVVRSCRCNWHEQAHPGFRREQHVHASQIFLVRRPASPS